MGYRKLEDVLCINDLKEGDDPTYTIDNPEDVVYLGLAGELAKEFKCSKITLPMLELEQVENKLSNRWEKELQNALQKIIVQKPQKHADSFTHACSEFTKEMANVGLSEDQQDAHIWFCNKETRLALIKQLKFTENGKYYIDKYEDHYFLDRCCITLDIPNGIICMAPMSELFGVLSRNNKFFNFMFYPKRMVVYKLKELKVSTETSSVHNLVFG